MVARARMPGNRIALYLPLIHERFRSRMPQLKLNQLDMLVAVADHGGFGAAAAALGCTQSRISHAITELEAVVGTRLLTRSRTGCAPTEAGLRVLVRARHMLHLAGDIVAEGQSSATLAGRVRIACFRSVGMHLLPSALAALATGYPAIRIDIDDACEERDDVTRAVLDGRAEIGIAQLPVSDAFVTRRYVADDYVLVLPAACALRTPVHWEQLRALPFIALDCSGAAAVLARCRAAGFDAVPARTMATDTSIAALVRLGMGYAMLPRLAVFPVPEGVQVAELPIAARREFALVCLPEPGRGKLVRAVMGLLGSERILRQNPVVRSGLVTL
jgi:DNA-binding transcriptional LysR family regulator